MSWIAAMHFKVFTLGQTWIFFPIVSNFNCPSRQQGEYRAVQAVMSGAQGPPSKLHPH